MSNPYREEFISIYTQNITREGSQKLLAWLDTTDFYTAPASTKFHCACESGLVMHSLNVYKAMRERWFDEGDSEESFAICALLHDVCKSQFYKTSTRNVKNDETGQWEKRPFYTVDDAFPFGHGENPFTSSSVLCVLSPWRPWQSAGTWVALTTRRRAAALPSAWHLTAIRSP